MKIVSKVIYKQINVTLVMDKIYMYNKIYLTTIV